MQKRDAPRIAYQYSLFLPQVKPQGSIKEDWCGYAIGQDFRKSFPAAYYLCNGKMMMTSPESHSEKELRTVASDSVTWKSISVRWHHVVCFGGKSARNGRIGTVGSLTWFEAAKKRNTDSPKRCMTVRVYQRSRNKNAWQHIEVVIMSRLDEIKGA